MATSIWPLVIFPTQDDTLPDNTPTPQPTATETPTPAALTPTATNTPGTIYGVGDTTIRQAAPTATDD